ncbi:MAG: hypothetical protein ABIC19_04740 [Patescibacteria group bacterium]|nr:hypothetical protein [Patescibacteria group bacterium]
MFLKRFVIYTAAAIAAVAYLAAIAAAAGFHRLTGLPVGHTHQPGELL